MTREEAIRILKNFSLCGVYHQLIHMNDTDSEAISMAIKALEAEPCEDAVSRRDAIDAIYKCTDIYINNLPVMVDKADAYKALADLTSAQPEQRWISVSERLPEDDTEVFVYLFDRPSPYIAWVCDGCWFTEEFQVEKENYPKAWCELPEPYKERREE